MAEKPEIQEEIDLANYIKIILKRKWIILAIFFIATITTGIISFLTPPIYGVTASIQNGYLREPVIKKSETEEIIKSYDFLNPIIEKLKLKIKVEELRKSIKIEDIKNISG